MLLLLTILVTLLSPVVLFHTSFAMPTTSTETIFDKDSKVQFTSTTTKGPKVVSKYAYLELERFSSTPPNSSKIENSDESIFTADDQTTQEDWGGNCTLAYWDRCKVIKVWFSWYKNPSKNPSQPIWLQYELDCKIEPILCMKNGWSINRCHILCMGQCNKEMLYKFDKYVSHENECKAHAHG